MFTKEDPSWQSVTNPATGTPFANYNEYAAFAGGGRIGGGAATAPPAPTPGTATATTAGGKTDPYPTWGTPIDWSKTGWGVSYGTSDTNDYVPIAGKVGFTYGTDQAGYIDPVTGQIAIGNRVNTPDAYGGSPAIMNPNDPNSSYRSTLSGGSYYDPYADYGMGKGYEGIVPVEHDQQGRATYYVPGMGGTYTLTQDLTEAKAAMDAYKTQTAASKGPGVDPATGMPKLLPAPGPGASAGSTTTQSGPGATSPGVLMTPGQTETYYDNTKDFYTQPTEGKKAWDETANQPTKIEQTWNAFSGQFNQPSNAEDLYGNYRETFSDPRYLDEYWNIAEKNAKGAQEARAAAAGVGDSSMAMRAGSNLSSLYDQNRLKSMQDFATTGMGLATSADTGFNQRAAGSATLAGLTDKGANDRIATANTVDQGMLTRTTAGQNASNLAQSATERRLTGGLSSAADISGDVSQLVSLGLDRAQSEKFATDLQAIALDMQSGNLSFEQAMAKATEMANLPNTISNTYFQYWLASKLLGGGSTTPTSTSSSATPSGTLFYV